MKKYLTILIVSVLIIPQIALAAWWNPFSWFKKSSAFPTAKITQVASTTSTTSQIKEKPTTNINTNTSIPKSVPVKPKVVLPIKLTNAEIIKKVKPAVVYINTKDGSGSGMIIASDGYVLTNAHVVKGSQNADISIFSGSTFSASVIGRDEEVDVAILKIVSDQKFSTVELADSDKVMQGDNVFTLGYPFGIKGDVSFKEGTISRRIEDYFETSAEIHPGNSGGPLVNIYGQVIGINSASYGNSVQGVQVGETIKLAIPVNTAKNIIPDLKNGRSIIIPELSDSKPSTTKTNADLKSEYTTFRNKLFQVIDEYGVVYNYAKASILNFNEARCDVAILNANNAISSTNTNYQFTLELEVPQVPFHDTAFDLLKTFRTTMDYQKQIMQTIGQYCSKYLQGYHPDDLSNLFNESLSAWRSYQNMDKVLMEKMGKLDDQEKKFFQ